MSERSPYPEGAYRAYKPNRRRANPAEMDAAGQLLQRALPLDADEPARGYRDENELASGWAGLVRRPDAATVMIVSAGEVIAATVSIPYDAMDPVGDEPPAVGGRRRTAYIYGVAVDGDEREQGYGFDVMGATLSSLKELGYTHAVMDCRIDGMWQLMSDYYGPTGSIVHQDAEPTVRWPDVGPQRRCELDLALATA